MQTSPRLKPLHLYILYCQPFPVVDRPPTSKFRNGTRGSDKGHMLHIWWSCLDVVQFQEKIFTQYDRMSSSSSPKTPEVALLSGSAKKGLLMFFLSTARRIIPRHWKNPDRPSIVEWATEMTRLRRMEELKAKIHDRLTAVQDTWTQWDFFVDSEAMKTALGQLDASTMVGVLSWLWELSPLLSSAFSPAFSSFPSSFTLFIFLIEFTQHFGFPWRPGEKGALT